MPRAYRHREPRSADAERNGINRKQEAGHESQVYSRQPQSWRQRQELLRAGSRPPELGGRNRHGRIYTSVCSAIGEAQREPHLPQRAGRNTKDTLPCCAVAWIVCDAPCMPTIAPHTAPPAAPAPRLVRGGERFNQVCTGSPASPPGSEKLLSRTIDPRTEAFL